MDRIVTHTALVRRPGPRLAEGLVTHIRRTPVDVGLARRQWDAYVQTLRDSGWRTVEVPPADDCPDSVFIEDTLVVRRDVAVVTRPGAPSRRPETEAPERAVAELGYRVERIVAPATLDGGDVLQVGATIYVGLGGRTNRAGVEQFAEALAPTGATVVPVELSRVLHLKSAVTALPDGSVIGYPPLLDDTGCFPRFVAVPEESGSHVVDLGGGRLLMADDCPRTAEMLSALGYRPVPVGISEFQKLEGCVTCLSVRLPDAGADPITP
jgi:dimethylargininase